MTIAKSPDELDHLARDVLDNLHEGCQVIGFDWKYLYVDDAVANQGKQPKNQLIGRTMMDCYPGIERTPMFSMLERCMKERSYDRIENQFAFPDGSTGFRAPIRSGAGRRLYPFNHGILDSNVPFLQKPFTPDSLVLKVREVLAAAISPVKPADSAITTV